jgi:hypothetical protein
MAGCLRSAVLLALRTKLIEIIGRLPGLFEKLRIVIPAKAGIQQQSPWLFENLLMNNDGILDTK